MSDDNVTHLPVHFKALPVGDDLPVLKIIEEVGRCNHRTHVVIGGDVLGGRLEPVQYLIRPGETEVECGACGQKLDPMFVLRAMAEQESRWTRAHRRYHDEMKRLSDRSRTKCEKCGAMTRISR